LSRSKYIALGLALVLLAGCSFDYSTPAGQGSDSLSSAGGSTGSGSAELAWEMPTQNTNGTSLSDLAGYTIVYGTGPNAMNHWVQLTNIGTTSYVINGLGQGTWYFAVLSYTLSGANSPLSNIGTKTIP